MGRETQGRRTWEEQNNPRTEYKSRTKPNTSEGVFIPAETGQTGSMDRSDQLVRPVRPVPGTGWSADSAYTRSHLTAELLSSQQSLLYDAAILRSGPRFWKVRETQVDGRF